MLSWEPCGDAVHIFTHAEWHMRGYLAECVEMAETLTWERAKTILSRLCRRDGAGYRGIKARNMGKNSGFYMDDLS